MSDKPDTGMRLYEGENWVVRPDLQAGAEDDDPKSFVTYREDAHTGQRIPVATLRRIGWLDQKGRVYTGSDMPRSGEFDGGSLTPLLIDPREDGH